MNNKNCNNFLIMDFETGGFDARKNAITEFAGIWIESGDFSEIARYEAVVAPYDKNYGYESEALNHTGITMEQIQQGSSLALVIANIIKNTEKCNSLCQKTKKTILVGQNISFDIKFLQQIAFVSKTDLSKLFSGDTDFHGNFYPHYMDTMTLGRSKWASDDTAKRFSLKDLVALDNIELVDAHRAMNDVEATKELFQKYIMSLRQAEDVEINTGKSRFRNKFQFQI